jgi:hypothetical protein
VDGDFTEASRRFVFHRLSLEKFFSNRAEITGGLKAAARNLGLAKTWREGKLPDF